jgi:hypothetical protein
VSPAGWWTIPAVVDSPPISHRVVLHTGLGGRPRTTGSSQERARIAARKAISAAIDRIATVDETLARHLRARIHTGLTCSYDPNPPTPSSGFSTHRADPTPPD